MATNRRASPPADSSVDRKDVGERRARIVPARERVRPAHHDEPAALLHVARELRKVSARPYGCASKSCRTTASKVGRCSLKSSSTGKGMSARSSWLAFTSSVLRAQDEEGDDVDRRVALEPHAERAHVVGRAAGDVQHAHAIARDVERDEPAVVLGDRVARRAA